MNEEVLPGSERDLEEQERLEMEMALQANLEEQKRLEAIVAEQQSEAVQAQPQPQPEPELQTPVQTTETPTQREVVETSPFKAEDGSLDWEKLDRYGKEGDMDLLTGIWDFAAPIVNMIPGVTAKPAPKFENEVAQSIREISSVVVPTMVLGGAGIAAIGSKAKHVGILNDPIVKTGGQALFSAGAGAFVDYTVPMNQTDDNLTGSLKKSWPRTFGWIPNNIATIDGDNPETKRWKNVAEGTYLGLFTDFIQGFGKLTAGVRGVDQNTHWVPESEKSKKWFSDNVVLDKTADDVVERSAAKRSIELDEVGTYNFQKSIDPEEPVFGYHDMYGYQESGIRSVDDLGIVGASVDVVRINKNLNTAYGRVGSVMSEGALKFANESSENARNVMRGLGEILQDAGPYGYKVPDSRYITHEEIMEDGMKLASDFYNMDLQELQRTIRPGSMYQGTNVSTGTPELTDEAYAGVLGAIQKYMDDFINMDEARAVAYTGTSFAGQISDTAMGMRLTEGSGSIQRAQEQILDRVEFLMAQKGMTSYVRGRALNQLNLWNRMTTQGSQAYDDATRRRIANQIKNEKNPTLRAIEKLKQEAAETTDGLREISKSNPEMLAPLMMAYELTDGNVKSITGLNNYLRQSSQIWRKAFIDMQPEIPSLVNQAFFANVYNNTLSAFATPIKAGISGAHLLIEKPIRTFAGALVNRDLQTIRRGWYQYSAMGETIKDSLGYASNIMKRSATDPNVIQVRDDVLLRNQKQLEVLKSFADAKARNGDFGPQLLVERIEEMNDLANHPVMRFGTRAMQATDGFVQSMVAAFESKGRAFDEVTRGGTHPFDADKATELADKVQAGMFNEKGIITDEAVQKAAGEISLNLDNAANNDLSALIRRMPVLKPFLLFTKTPLNEMALTLSYNPLGLFVKDLNAFKHRFDEMPIEKVKDLLSQRGVDVSDPVMIKGKYEEIRADLRGRKAIGTITTGLGVSLFLDDRLHGAGHYNRQVQKTRDESDYKRNSIRGLDNKWYSFEGLGPITNYLSLVATAMDNYDVLAPNEMGEILKRAAFTFGASFTDKTYLAGLEPFMDVLRGDVGAINRWSSSFLTAANVRGSSQMAEIARLMDPGMKQINNDLEKMVRNRLPLLKSTLPAKYDWIDGKEVNVPDNIMARFRNTYTPWKESGEISKEKQFLIDIEYDASPTLRTNGRGEKLNGEQQSDILSIMGQDGLWKEAIQEVMQSTDGKAFRKRFKEARAKNLPVDTSTFESVHMMLDDKLRRAMGDAQASSQYYTVIQRKQEIRERTAEYLKRGDQDGAVRYLNYTKKKFGY